MSEAITYQGKMYEKMIEMTKTIINTHNQNLPPELHLNWDEILLKLKKLGGTTSTALQAASWEDVESCGVPRILARQMAKAWREEGKGQSQGSNDTAGKNLKPSTVSSMSYRELFEHYDPVGERNSLVNERLQKESDGKACVVFDGDKVDAALSADTLRELKQGLPERSTIIVNGKVSRLYCVGDTPNQYWDENPLYPGEPLRAGETCPHTHFSWAGVRFCVRQLLYLALTETKEIHIDDTEGAHRIVDLLRDDGHVNKLTMRFPEASARLHDQSNTGNAPTLKLAKNGEPKSNRPNDPFYKHVRT